mmetsp:Transcript_5816/g.10464  ORF Transcript_5816/g.10464 Transcript_5816/m.10464 type:complete len:95 (-) Transcript_5816:928-1212(-)
MWRLHQSLKLIKAAVQRFSLRAYTSMAVTLWDRIIIFKLFEIVIRIFITVKDIASVNAALRSTGIPVPSEVRRCETFRAILKKIAQKLIRAGLS